MSVSSGPSRKSYTALVDSMRPAKPVLRNVLRAFWVGGLICLIGECVEEFFVHIFHFSEKTAGNPTVAIMILLAVILTGFGVYDKISQYAGAGTAVPVTGFANSIAAAALEHKTEGYVVGVGTNMFKIAGPVIVFGVVAAFVVAFIAYAFIRLHG
ncbi:stage V sporulation protein AC [Ferroacidibacillus organovorans]|uniref:Stage V sporulation protein AC n=1 Tax=Ferroacidibacillus organovorans TaxID=1765683 RepID=A0A101XQW3_9BACL|nr:stage V sporulation protein AC [Ferroacidibacillus organovorans]KUO95876.1 stage V sporulation protein AC [Ferroacidibacillus organovorans]